MVLEVLKFAQRAKFIKNHAIQNQDFNATVPLLKEEIGMLKKQLEEMTNKWRILLAFSTKDKER